MQSPCCKPFRANLCRNRQIWPKGWRGLHHVENNQIMTHQDPKILKFVKEYCLQYLSGYGILSLYFFGSRVNGVPRLDSDHDFFLVINDGTSHEITTGTSGHMRIFTDLDSRRRAAGLGAIDLLIARNSYFMQESTKRGTFAHAAKNGVQIL